VVAGVRKRPKELNALGERLTLETLTCIEAIHQPTQDSKHAKDHLMLSFEHRRGILRFEIGH
jgi:hypothetical protein